MIASATAAATATRLERLAPERGHENEDHLRLDFCDVLGREKHARADLSRDANGVPRVVELFVVAAMIGMHERPVDGTRRYRVAQLDQKEPVHERFVAYAANLPAAAVAAFARGRRGYLFIGPLDDGLLVAHFRFFVSAAAGDHSDFC